MTNVQTLLKRFGWLAASLLATFVLSACDFFDAAPEQRFVKGSTMGTTYSMKWYSHQNDQDEIAAAAEQLLIDVNQIMSTYIPDSELSRFNQSPSLDWVEVSSELIEVLSLSQTISDASNGQFDVTVGPLVNLWGFGPKGRVVTAPSSDQITNTQAVVGYTNLQVDESQNRVKKAFPELYVDLSAIAKGYGVDLLAKLLEERGIVDYLVEIGGELRISGQKPDQTPWKVAIEAPSQTLGQIQRVVSASGMGMATSGDYRNYFEENGVRYSHTIDPSTGAPIAHRLASVTVLAPTCALADGLATAFTVIGPEAAKKLAQQMGVEAFFITKTDDGFEESYTAGFEQYLVD